MWTGKQTLQSLETGLNSVKADLNHIDQELHQITQAITSNQQTQTRTLLRLAEIRLDEIKSGSLMEALDHADQETLNILQQRETALGKLEGEISDAEQGLQQSEHGREDFTRRVDECAKDVIETEHTVQSKLENDSDYQTQLEQARIADSIADEAEEKGALAEQDRIEKGKPFENDVFFHYLWKRHYGTTEYKANPLARILDGWVARLCQYEDNRVNYWTLLEIPKRLKEHADDVRATAESETKKLQDLEKQAALDNGVPKTQEALRSAEEKLEQYDAQIAQTAKSRNRLLEQRAVFVSGQDSFTQSCVSLLKEVMERSDVFELSRAVTLTPTRKDDALARELSELRVEKDDLQTDLEKSRQRQDKQLKRLKELEDVRHKFKQHRFDDLRSGFNNEALLTSVLSQFLNGMLSGSDLWGTMQRHQRHRDVGAWPDFGSGGLGRGKQRKTRSVWHTPGRSSGGGFRLPRNGGFSSRGRSGGGFRTGGGF